MTIEFRGVTKAFGQTKVLDDLSFAVAPGEILFILGRSGVGKSVTLKHIVGLLKPDAGRILVDSEDVTRLDTSGLSRVRRKCGMVFQHPALWDSINVYENMTFGLKTPQYIESIGRELTDAEIRQSVEQKLKLVHLNQGILSRFPSQLSFGVQKRVSLVRTILPGPSYLLFDEPTTGLDPMNTRAINALILDLSRKLRVTSIVVSHDMASALAVADRILVLDQGGILAIGSPHEIRQSEVTLIREFLKEAREEKAL